MGAQVSRGIGQEVAIYAADELEEPTTDGSVLWNAHHAQDIIPRFDLSEGGAIVSERRASSVSVRRVRFCSARAVDVDDRSASAISRRRVVVKKLAVRSTTETRASTEGRILDSKGPGAGSGKGSMSGSGS